MVLTLGTVLVYGKLAGYDFARYDDEVYVTANWHVQHGPFVKQLAWAFTTTEGWNWHPLTWLSHILDFRLYGLWAGGHHLTNIFLHAINTICLFWLLRRMTGAFWRSAMVAALFAWHPLHVESVAWIAERKDVLSTCLGLLATAAYVRHVEERKAGGASRKWYFLALSGYALALLCKPMLVTLPFVFVLLDYWPLRRTSSLFDLRFVLEKIPFLALSAVLCLVTLHAQTENNETTGQHFANAIVSYSRYLRKMVWPSDLCVLYPFDPDLPFELVVASGSFLLLVTAAVAVGGRSRPWLLVGWLWYLGTLVPVIGFVQVGFQSMADRYSYIPLVGVFIMLVWTAAELVERRLAAWRPVAAGIAGVLLASCLAVTWFQLTTWRNGITLFTRAIEVTTRNYMAEDNLGIIFYGAGKQDEAIPHFEAARAARPDSPVPPYNLGRAYEAKGDLERAAVWFETAVRTKDDFAPARYDFARVLAKQGNFKEAISQYTECLRYTSDPATVHFGLANALVADGQLPAAVEHFRQSIALRDSPDVRNNLGAVLMRQGNAAAAAEEFRAALKLWPNYAEAEDQLGGALQKLGKIEEASRHFAEAVRLNPGFTHARLKLGMTLAQQQRFDDAREQFQKVIQLEPTNDVAWFNLAGTYAAQGRPDDAAPAFTRVVSLKPADVEARINLGEVLARAGRTEAALAEFERAAALTGSRDPLILAMLDRALAETGRFDEAVKAAQQTQALAASLNQSALADQAGRRMELYRQGKRPSEK